jgi:drug/metabolite transporter (DMT)-like permease
MTDIPLVLLLGILSTVQTHLAKALERQGIEVFDQIKAKLQKSGQRVEGGLKKPVIYTVGLVLNNTLFIWSTLAQPHGPPALFTSMFGMGLVFLMVYAAAGLKEKITRLEIAGAAAIVAGTLVIGIENISRAEVDRFSMNLTGLFLALGVWLTLSLVLIGVANRTRDLGLIALAFGALAGGLGSLDPFFKGVGQNYGGRPGILPSSSLGTAIFASSFVIGFLAFVVTQIGFARKVRASLLVPAYNAAFIGLPILWQVLLLPDYRLSWMTVAGLLLILGGVVGMQAFKKEKRPALEHLPQPDRS